MEVFKQYVQVLTNKLITDNKEKKPPKQNILLAKEGMKKILSEILLREKKSKFQNVVNKCVLHFSNFK